MSAPTDGDAIPGPLDSDATEILGLAAALGAATDDDVFVSFTTLLLALLFAPSGEVTRLSSGVLVNAIPPWQTEAAQELDVAAILAARQLTRPAVAEIVRHDRGVPPAMPSGRPLLSVSARTMLRAAVDLATAARGSGARASPADMMAAYVHRIPAAHQDQMRAWGLTADVAQRIASQLSVPAPAAADASDLPGFSAAAAALIRLSAVLSWNPRGQTGTGLPSAARRTDLLAAALLLPLVSPRHGRPELRLLAEMTEADDPAAPAGALLAQYRIPDTAAEDIERAAWTDKAVMPGLQALLDQAAALAGEDATVEPVHLVGALLADGNDAAGATVGDEVALRAHGLQALRDALLALVARDHPHEAQERWRLLLAERDRRLLAPARPDVIPDDPRAADTLDVRRFADALGGLIAAGEQKPPLSIAVFGPWGSGKSYFMAMIRAAVREFAGAGAGAHAAGRDSVFLRRVVQIEFNAWHYAEGNLWASLVHAILVGLQGVLVPQDRHAPFQAMLDRLQMHQAAQAEALLRVQEATGRLEAARAAQAQAEAQAEARRAQESGVPSSGDVLLGVQDMALDALRPPGRADAAAWIASVGGSVEQVARYLGRPELAAQVPALQAAAKGGADTAAALQVTVGEVQDLLDQARASTQRGSSLLGWLANSGATDQDRQRLLLAGPGLLLALLVLAVALERWGADIAAFATAVSAVVAPLIGLAAAGVAWGRRHVADAARAFAVLGSIRDRVEATRGRRLSDRDAALLAARRSTQEAEAEAARRQAEVDAAAAAVRQAEEAMRLATSPEQLKLFVAQRLADGDYQRHLGLIHTIRTDMERLGEILRSVHPGEAAAGGEPPVQRIVLYIDDLDRCPPARVVEVLEAVHLLLAFPLFVAVVGVDIRWVAQALRRRYPLQLGDRPGVASPVDYLEKVFQIPFWLPPMDAPAARRLLDAAIGPARPDDRPDDVKIDEVTAGAAARPAADAIPAPAPAADPIAPQRPAAALPAVPAQALAEALLLGGVEREQLLALAASVGASPRRAKRFANLYRLLKASLSPAESRRFVVADGAAGSYAGALVLLAMATGAPRATRAMLDLLAAQPEAELDLLLAAGEAAAGDGEKAAFRGARDGIDALAGRSELAGHFRRWAPLVRRFTFDGGA